MYRWVVLSLVCVGGAGGVLVSFLLGQAAATRHVDSTSTPHMTGGAEVLVNGGAARARAPGPESHRPLARALEDAPGAREELRLIEEANGAIARGDFASALSPLIEHERRFQHGWLTREREVLSVRAIDGLLISQPASFSGSRSRSGPVFSPAGRSRARAVLSAAVSRP